MRDVYLVNYSVKGIKTLNQLITLSFYKKTFKKEMDTQSYNIKGIYGMNGAGKTAIITSVDILKNILINSSYLNNPMVQNHLDEIINKELQELNIKVDFVVKFVDILSYFRYEVILSKNAVNQYNISWESLSYKKATSKEDKFDKLFEVGNGEFIFLNQENEIFADFMKQKTINLLSNSSLSSLFYEKILVVEEREEFFGKLLYGLFALLLFGNDLHVYLDYSDKHKDYLVNNAFQLNPDFFINDFFEMNKENMSIIGFSGNIVSKELFHLFELDVQKLCEFLQIFKPNIRNIEIDKKENRDDYICDLIMVYDLYKVHAEFESTGIKKLILLYMYLKEAAQGGIVFIDELDSNLHDVYLCALLEYLMSYGKGQLCFTTHNVGPMDVLKQNKKSIDFLSENGQIYPWVTNGNYSPSSLYRNGMIEGSPFNVDSIDFIGVFGSLTEE